MGGAIAHTKRTSGHRISIGEVESALTSHQACAETAAIGFDHDVEGQGFYAFVTLIEGISPTEQLKNEIKAAVRRESINKGECPRELEPADCSTQVHVNLVKKDEEWEAPPQPKYVAFGGTGRTLGSATPAPVSEAPTTSPASGLEAANQPFQGLVVDESKPSTSIHLRLSDGTRMVARFNHTHTVADVRGFIDAARLGSVGPYSLETMGFPPSH